jgi:hypothetical protein
VALAANSSKVAALAPEAQIIALQTQLFGLQPSFQGVQFAYNTAHISSVLVDRDGGLDTLASFIQSY